MTSLPPPGRYPDPQNAGRSWRWWDGGQWAPPAPPAYYDDPYRAARAREQSGRFGRWLRYAMVGNALYALVSYGAIAALFHDVSHQFLVGPGRDSQFSGRFVAIQLASMPLGFLGSAAARPSRTRSRRSTSADSEAARAARDIPKRSHSRRGSPGAASRARDSCRPVPAPSTIPSAAASRERGGRSIRCRPTNARPPAVPDRDTSRVAVSRSFPMPSHRDVRRADAPP
jgi:hypothetical protein